MMHHSTSGVTWLHEVAAIFCNATAQVLVKRTAPASALPLQQWLDPVLAPSVVLYGFSFIPTARVYARLPLSGVSQRQGRRVRVLGAVAARPVLRPLLV